MMKTLTRAAPQGYGVALSVRCLERRAHTHEFLVMSVKFGLLTVLLAGLVEKTDAHGSCESTCAGAKMWEAAMMDMRQYTGIAYTCKPDVDFMAGMIGHHAGAIAMCQVLYALTAPGKVAVDPLIGGASDKMPYFAAPGSMCYNVTTSQTTEVVAMKAWLVKNGYPSKPTQCGPGIECGLSCSSSLAYEGARAIMMAGMSLDYTCDPTADFIAGMIAHHNGAVHMCQVLFDAKENGTPIDPEVHKMCHHVVGAQTTEIDFMTKWLTARGYPSNPATCHMAKAEEASLAHSATPMVLFGIAALVAVPLFKRTARAYGQPVAAMA